MSSSGTTVKNIEPRVLRQTVSPSTSEKIIQYCEAVVMGDEGTGKTARPAGYRIIGKTGTAQTLPRGNRQYVVSFMGAAPADDPEIAIYVVVDRPNVADQSTSTRLATTLVRDILTEALPYLNYPMTEELSEAEQAELASLREQLITTAPDPTAEENAEEVEGEEIEAAEEASSTESSEQSDNSLIWETFDRDAETGYYVDPETGALIDPETGTESNGDVLPDFTGTVEDSSTVAESN